MKMVYPQEFIKFRNICTADKLADNPSEHPPLKPPSSLPVLYEFQKQTESSLTKIYETAALLDSTPAYKVVHRLGGAGAIIIYDTEYRCIFRFTKVFETVVIETEFSPVELKKFNNPFFTEVAKLFSTLEKPSVWAITPEMISFVRNSANWNKEPLLLSAIYTFIQEGGHYWNYQNPYAHLHSRHWSLTPLHLATINDVETEANSYLVKTFTLKFSGSFPVKLALNSSNFDRDFWRFIRMIYPDEFVMFRDMCLTDKQIRDTVWSQSSTHTLFSTPALHHLICSYLPSVKNYFEKSELLSQEKKTAMVSYYKTQIQNMNAISIVVCATQLLKSFGIPETLLMSCTVRIDSPLGKQLDHLFLQREEQNYIYLVIPTYRRGHATPVVINVKKKEIYCIDPRNNELIYEQGQDEFAEEQGVIETNTLLEARSQLENAITEVRSLKDFRVIDTPLNERTAIQSGNDSDNCGIHSVMIITGIILNQENISCPASIQLNPTSGAGIQCRDSHVDEFIVVTELARNDFDARPIKNKPLPIMMEIEDEETMSLTL